MKTLSLALLMLPSFAVSQDVNYHWFMRTPQVVNWNMTDKELGHASLVSTGVGASYRSVFTELGAYVSNESLYGVYSFSGTNLSSKQLDERWALDTNLFGTVMFSPAQEGNVHSWTYTGGMFFYVRHSTEWGTFGFPLVFGIAYTKPTVSFTTQVMFNFTVGL